jgi:signal transduction histidine kinase
MALFSFKRIRNRIILFISGITVLFLIAVLYLRKTEIAYIEKIVNDHKVEKNLQLGKSIHILGKHLESFTDDYSRWNDMVNFVYCPDSLWAKHTMDIDDLTNNIHAVWVYNRGFKRIYSSNLLNDTGLVDIPIGRENIPKFLGRNLFCHFFVFSKQGLLEIRGAPIQKNEDKKRVSQPDGYLFAGFLWSKKYLDDLTELTSCRNIGVVPSTYRQEPDNKSKTTGRSKLITISNSKKLYGWDEKEIAKVVMNSELPIDVKTERLFNFQFFILLGFSIIIIFVILIFLIHYVNNPLQLISKSLETGDIELLEKVNTSDDEFRELTNLLKAFFQQKKEFEKEIKRRIMVEKEIKQLNEELEQRVLERTMQLETINIRLIKDIEERKLLLEELIIAKEKAEESDNLKSVFLANMSHEIRTPLNAMLGFASFFKKPNLPEEKRKKYIEIIDESGNQLLTLINDIIDVSKIEAGQIKISETALDLNKKMNILYNLFLNDLRQKEKKKVKLKLNLPENKLDYLVLLDDFRLTQVITNLVGNALKFTLEGTIEFGYEVLENKKIMFFVKDQGIGIPKDKQRVIFERFRQAQDSSTRRYGGTGLGLTISKSLVELMGGKIWVESEEGKGAQFYFTVTLKPV